MPSIVAANCDFGDENQLLFIVAVVGRKSSIVILNFLLLFYLFFFYLVRSSSFSKHPENNVSVFIVPFVSCEDRWIGYCSPIVITNNVKRQIFNARIPLLQFLLHWFHFYCVCVCACCCRYFVFFAPFFSIRLALSFFSFFYCILFGKIVNKETNFTKESN